MKELTKWKQEKLVELVNSDNIAADMEESELREIGMTAVDEYEADESDERRADKKELWEAGQEMARKLLETKDTPFENAANVKYPLLNIAAIQFNARAYPEIVQGNSVVKPKTFGMDSPDKFQRAQVVAEFMNWQLFQELEEWDEDTDRLLMMLPLYGCMFRKIWFSRNKKRICTQVLSPEEVTVPPKTQKINTAPRITTCFTLFPKEIVERVNSGEYIDLDITFEDEDAEAPEEFIEQCRWMDLDEDGVKEPYIVTVHVESNSVVQVIANYTLEDVKINDDKVYRIDPRQYFVKYTFVPSTDGCFYDTGFFDLLYPINEVINTTINQLLDAGSLANRNTGFIGKELSLRKKGPVKPEIGEFMPVNSSGADIRSGIVRMDFGGADPTLFRLLGFMVDIAREVANIKDVLQGQTETNMQPTTVHALIEQGLKTFSAIYKRTHRSMQEELELIREWNYISKNPLAGEVVDLPDGFDVEWFNGRNYDFELVSDPSAVTDALKAVKAQVHGQFFNDPYFDQDSLREKYYAAQGLDYSEVRAGQNPEVQQLQQQLQQMQQQMQQIAAEYDALQEDKSNEVRRQEFDEKMRLLTSQLEQIQAEWDVKEKHSKVIKNLADAESKEPGEQLGQYERKARQL